ncbi:GNAT family N-acetyltransferase [Streptococcus suis]
MPIRNIRQSEQLEIDTTVRLRAYDGQYELAFDWHQNMELVWLVDGVKEVYSLEKLARMYRFLSENGECYWIEIREKCGWRPIGDVTLLADDFAISIGDSRCWARGIGGKVLKRMIERAKELGFTEIRVGEIYDWNIGSQRLFEKMGFSRLEKTEKGWSYKVTV